MRDCFPILGHSLIGCVFNDSYCYWKWFLLITPKTFFTLWQNWHKLTLGVPLTEQLRVALYPAMTERFTRGCVNLGACEKSWSLCAGGLYAIPGGGGVTVSFFFFSPRGKTVGCYLLMFDLFSEWERCLWRCRAPGWSPPGCWQTHGRQTHCPWWGQTPHSWFACIARRPWTTPAYVPKQSNWWQTTRNNTPS